MITIVPSLLITTLPVSLLLPVFRHYGGHVTVSPSRHGSAIFPNKSCNAWYSERQGSSPPDGIRSPLPAHVRLTFQARRRSLPPLMEENTVTFSRNQNRTTYKFAWVADNSMNGRAFRHSPSQTNRRQLFCVQIWGLLMFPYSLFHLCGYTTREGSPSPIILCLCCTHIRPSFTQWKAF